MPRVLDFHTAENADVPHVVVFIADYDDTDVYIPVASFYPLPEEKGMDGVEYRALRFMATMGYGNLGD